MKNLILLSALLGIAVCYANDITEFRGEGRRGFFDKEKNLLNDWKAQKPKELWYNDELGDAYGSLSIVGDKIFTTGIGKYETEEVNEKDGKNIWKYDGREFLYALSKKDGKLLWSVDIGESSGGKDPKPNNYPAARSTPTYVDGHLYVVSGAGDVACVTVDGKIVWQANIVKDFNGKPTKGGMWGWSISPLVYDGKVIFTIGADEGTMIALDAKTGKKVWLSDALGGPASYASPNLIEKNGKKQVVGMNEDWMFGVDPANGKVAWKFGLKQLEELGEGGAKDHFYIFCVTPVLMGNMVISSCGYHVGTFAVEVNDTLTEAKFAWIVPDLDARMGHPAFADGIVWVAGQSKKLGAIDAKTGEVLWRYPWGHAASVTAADGMLYCLTEWSGLVLVEMSKTEVTENKGGIRGRGGLLIGGGVSWSHPVISDGVLYIRNGNALAAFDVKK